MTGRVKEIEIAVLGAGPAGLCAAEAAARHGASVYLIDRNPRAGGQLHKQTHMFFGSREQYAAQRGFVIAAALEEQIVTLPRCTLLLETWVLGLYEDNTLLVERRGEISSLRARKIIVATGAMENALAFPGCDLPGIYGAGAVQTLMNLHGVRPGRRAVMAGAGNIGLIVAYQLLQAGVEVAAVVETAPRIGGYLVHASKIRRTGVPIHTSATIKEAHGTECLEGVTVHNLDRAMNPLPGSERFIASDLLCLAAGLTPLAELLRQAGCRMAYHPRLGGFVPRHGPDMATSNPHIYVAGDAAGIGEATTAMLEGKIAGLSAALDLGHGGEEARRERREARRSREELLAGEITREVHAAIMALEEGVENPAGDYEAGGGPALAGDTLEKEGTVSLDKLEEVLPPAEYTGKGPLAVIECFQPIPCNPCVEACPRGAIRPLETIHHPPRVDFTRCNGCGLCAFACPGLAIFIADEHHAADRALLKIPYEFYPLPRRGEEGAGLGRDGRALCPARVEKVQRSPQGNKLNLLWLTVPLEYAREVRFWKRRKRHG